MLFGVLLTGPTQPGKRENFQTGHADFFTATLAGFVTAVPKTFKGLVYCKDFFPTGIAEQVQAILEAVRQPLVRNIGHAFIEQGGSIGVLSTALLQACFTQTEKSFSNTLQALSCHVLLLQECGGVRESIFKSKPFPQ